ncbi:MAG: hypothetical protein ACOY3P_12175 [Planctomycetota bacterium]
MPLDKVTACKYAACREGSLPAGGCFAHAVDIDGESDLDGADRPDILGANHGGVFRPVDFWLNRGK